MLYTVTYEKLVDINYQHLLCCTQLRMIKLVTINYRHSLALVSVRAHTSKLNVCGSQSYYTKAISAQATELQVGAAAPLESSQRLSTLVSGQDWYLVRISASLTAFVIFSPWAFAVAWPATNLAYSLQLMTSALAFSCRCRLCHVRVVVVDIRQRWWGYVYRM